MLIVLTDILTCPRCGPEFGLVVMADRLEDRRVVEGGLGCANCREIYPIADGLPDLRYPPGEKPAPPPDPGPHGADDTEAAVRLAALLGVTGGPGVVLIAGAGARLAGTIAEVVPGLGAVALGSEVIGVPDRDGTSRVLSDERLPVRDRAVLGVALGGWAADRWLEEGLRVLVPGGRIVLDPAPPTARERLREAGFGVLLDQDDTVVASRTPHR